MKALEPKQGNMCRGGHKIHLFDCCLIDLLHCGFINHIIMDSKNSKSIANQLIISNIPFYHYFIYYKNLFDCCLIEISKDKKFIS